MCVRQRCKPVSLLMILLANYICNLRGEAFITFSPHNSSMFQGREGLIIKMEFNATHCGTPHSTSIGRDVPIDCILACVYFKGHEQNSCVLGQTTAFAVSKNQIMTAPAGRDDVIILSDLFRAENFVKERGKTYTRAPCWLANISRKCHMSDP